MALSISFSAVVPSQDYHVLIWSLSEHDPSWAVRITRGHTEQGPHDVVIVAALPTTATRIVDDLLPDTQRRWVGYTYRLHVIDTSTGDAVKTATASTPSPDSPYALRLADLIRRRLRESHGQPWHFLHRKNSGQRCPDCYDTARRRRTASQCDTCYNTTYVHGYDIPYPVFISAFPSAEAIQKNIFAEVEPSQTTLWTSNDPDLSVGDLLIEENNRRWRVVQINDNEYRRSVFRQNILADEVSQDDVVFDLSLIHI